MNRNRKTILLLGGSRQQVPAIEKAKDMGYYTILLDYLPDNPGQYVADKWYKESTTDIETVYKIAVKERVEGILAYASDPAALPAAIVCERLGLPTNPVHSVEILGVKHKFRKFLKDNGFACPSSIILSKDSKNNEGEALSRLSMLRFPIVIKPTDSSGSKGVSFINNEMDIPKAIEHAAEYSRNGILIAEEYIEKGFPYVVGGDIFIEKGKIILYGDMACMRTEGGKGLIPIGKRYPTGLTAKQKDRLDTELQRLIDKLNINSGEMNIEVIIDNDDNIHFLEVGPRAGGNMIPIQLSDIYGIDLIEANIKAAMGEESSLRLQKPDGFFLTYVIHSEKDGIFSHIEYSSEILKSIYKKVIYKDSGDPVEKFDGAGKALGILFLKFNDEATMLDTSQNMSEHIKVVLSE